MWYGRLLAFGVVAGLAGCAAPGLQGTGSGPVAQRDDQFKPYQEYATDDALVRTHNSYAGARLVARRDRTTGAITTYAYAIVGYIQRLTRRYEAARNERAEPLAFRQLSHEPAVCRRELGCAHRHMLEIAIPEADLRRALAAGQDYPIKLFARAGEEAIVPVTRAQIAALYKALEAAPRPATPPTAALPAPR